MAFEVTFEFGIEFGVDLDFDFEFEFEFGFGFGFEFEFDFDFDFDFEFIKRSRLMRPQRGAMVGKISNGSSEASDSALPFATAGSCVLPRYNASTNPARALRTAR